MSKKELTTRAARDLANEKVDKALRSAASWLRRRGERREKRETQRAYDEAATVILNRLHRR